ncbi:beta-carotene isomerase domain-containing protein [Geminocystis sp. GBBB08]|uniref:beta-carotene isomerase domain-containing protein n=1 Tax=Geminocystis sp. GBBB08 TaxID=2604140 RepID=UPI0027E2458B|nr:beta-carotene isomerase domain-containing protein [Geminocystis sp. GBBB08]MBL1208985.1 DUF4033 domain-containing protein [Geminocystis sp. GBBB08]
MNISEKTIYKDNLIDRIFIALFSRKMAKAVQKTSKFKGYDGFVDLSQQIMKGRNPQQQQELVEVVLKSLVPSPILFLIRTFSSPTKWVCESNAWFATVLFQWLVGKSEIQEVEIIDQNNQIIKQKSAVKIKKCRYLEESGCVGMCINMCKMPTQKFFTESFGIPLTMTPDFDDFSCEMVFGKYPPPFETEKASYQPCLKTYCPTSINSVQPCPKIYQ